MRRLTTQIFAACGAVVLAATLASAQNAQNDTVVTFSAPVSLPGVTLPAGSYLFRLADSQVNRNIVQVFDKDRSKIFATILAIPAERNEPADETVITFNESPANAAPAIRYWYYPGEKRGQEFAYPKSQATTIANAAHTSVLAVNSDSTDVDAMKTAEISRVEPGAEVAASQAPTESAPATAATPAAPATEQAPSAATASPSPATASQPAPTPAPATAAAQPTQPSASTGQPRTSSASEPASVGTSGSARTLPKTASPLPLVGFAGLLALGSAFGLRALRRARA
jgi:hypothetical protein